MMSWEIMLAKYFDPKVRNYYAATMTWQELLEKNYGSHVTQSFNSPHAYYTPKAIYDDGSLKPYARWIVQHDDGWYVQTGNHRSSMKEGTRYDTLQQAVVVAVALMTLKVER